MAPHSPPDQIRVQQEIRASQFFGVWHDHIAPAMIGPDAVYAVATSERPERNLRHTLADPIQK